MPFVDGNAGELSGDYSGSMATMAAEIDAATTYVHVEYYIRQRGRDDRGLLRRPRGGRQARRHRARAARPLGLVPLPRLQGDAGAAHVDGGAVAADAAGPAAEGPVPAHRPAQPPQAGRDRRHGRVRGFAEHDRPHLQQEVEHQARPDVAGAGVPGRGSCRGLDRLRLRHRLVHGDRRAEPLGGSAAGRPQRPVPSRQSGPRRRPGAARWCRAVRASRWRTTSSCS